LIDTGVLQADKYTTGNIEGAVVWERFTLQSEAFLSSVDLNAGPQTTASGAYVHFSWFLTGEGRTYERYGQHGSQFGRNKPFRNFSPGRGALHSGAWEFKTRWSHLDLNNFSRGQYNDLSVGFNWYWSDRVRMMFDWIRPYTSATTTFGRTDSDILGMRWDVNW
jgi:phosphate-selective porin OprO and OprP